MSAHIERQYSLYTIEQLFDLVADVEQYSLFLPWILSSRIVRREPNVVWVEMVLGIGPLQQRFSSQAVLHRPHTIEITSSDAPFDWLRQQWQFSTDHEGRTVVGYTYDFSLRSPVLELIPSALLDEGMCATLDAFEQRARQVYGAQAAPSLLQDHGALASPGVPPNTSTPAARYADTSHARDSMMPAPSALRAHELWIRLLLYPTITLPTAVAPVLVGIGLALRDGVFAPMPVLVAFLASWLIHVGGVFTDNHELLRRHPDVPEHPELLHALQAGTLTFAGLRGAILAFFALAALTVPYLLSIGGTLALVIGIVGAASSYCYAGGPRYVKHGLADPIFFAMFGIVAVVGTYYIQWAAVHGAVSHGVEALQRLPWEVFLIGLPVGALVTNVMLIDDIGDRQFDAVKGWRTFAVRFGLSGIRGEYLALTALAYVLPPVFWLGFGHSIWILLPLLTLPLGYNIARAVCTLDQNPELLVLKPRASYLAAFYSALLAAGIALPVH